jgi:hypothetical protein
MLPAGARLQMGLRAGRYHMIDLDDFLAPTLARQMEVERALVDGDAAPRLKMTSSENPVTVFGAKGAAPERAR